MRHGHALWLFVVLGGIVLVDAAAGQRPEACPTGQRRSADTQDHCCWPGQAWSSARTQCVGTPRCPAGLSATLEGASMLETCACPSGHVASDDTQGHCCLPGQAWSRSRRACIGRPTSCPTPTQFPSDDGCGECAPGQVYTTGGLQCCWPGQTLDADALCTGHAQCPRTMVTIGDHVHCSALDRRYPIALTCDGEPRPIVIRLTSTVDVNDAQANTAEVTFGDEPAITAHWVGRVNPAGMATFEFRLPGPDEILLVDVAQGTPSRAAAGTWQHGTAHPACRGTMTFTP